MGELIKAVELDVQPDYRMFGLGDQAAGPGEAPVPEPGFIGLGRQSFLIKTGGDTVHPTVWLEYWQDGLPEPEPEFEVQETFELELPTGDLILDLITRGGDSDFLRLPPGTHTVRVTGWERESTRITEAALFEYDVDSDEFEQAQQALHGRERYLIQFALKTASARLVDAIGYVVREGLDRLVVSDRTQAWHAVIPVEGVTSLALELWDAPPPQAGLDPVHVPLTGPDLKILPLIPGQQDYHDIPYHLTVPTGSYLGDWHIASDDEGDYCCVIRLWPGAQ